MSKIQFQCNKESNEFYRFVTNYFYFLREFKYSYETDPSYKIIVKPKLFSKNKTTTIQFPTDTQAEINNLIDEYNSYINYNKVKYNKIMNINQGVDSWFKIVKEFIIFLHEMELASLFKNEKGEKIYVDIDVKNSSYILYYYDEDKETEYRISFMDTSIPKPNTKSQLMQYLDAEDDENVTLIQIDILRKYGDNVTNQLKFIENSFDKSELLIGNNDFIFYVFVDILSKVIFDTFNDILSNVNELLGFRRNITQEVLHGYINLSE